MMPWGEAASAVGDLMDGLPTMIWVTDAGQNLTYVNRLARALLGRHADVAIGRPWLDFVHKDDRALVANLVSRRLEKKKPVCVEFRIVQPRARNRWVQAHLSATRDPAGTLSGLSIVLRDITRLKRIDGIVQHEGTATYGRGGTRLGLEEELRGAIERGDLVLHFQPKIEIPSLNVLGFEALVRWRHPARGLLAPSDFIGLAEDVQLIRPLTRWVFRATAHQLHHWISAGFAPKPVSVNITPGEFLDGLMTEHLPAFRAYDVPTDLLEIEITENALIDDMGAASTIVSRLKDDGIKVAMDDFGTGYSSLGRLNQLPISTIKIDRALTKDLHSNHTSRAVASGIIGIARELGLEIVAEGIETDAQLKVLSGMDCNIVQGFLTGRPMPAFEATQLLRSVARAVA